eukprot:13771855-Alexandrium_andersonii.AAC.1
MPPLRALRRRSFQRSRFRRTAGAHSGRRGRQCRSSMPPSSSCQLSRVWRAASALLGATGS